LGPSGTKPLGDRFSNVFRGVYEKSFLIAECVQELITVLFMSQPRLSHWNTRWISDGFLSLRSFRSYS